MIVKTPVYYIKESAVEIQHNYRLAVAGCVSERLLHILVIIVNVTYLISSLTPRLDRKFFMECQEVSAMPINLRTPSRTSLTTSGGARSDLT